MTFLSRQQVNEFISEGYTTLRGVFSSHLAGEIRDVLWEELGTLGYIREDPTSWREPWVLLRKIFTAEPFAGVWSKELFLAFDDVMGVDRYEPPAGLGWWPISFPGFETGPWAPPDSGWHVDGIHYQHHIDARDQGLLPLFIVSDIAPGTGGTVVSAGSHRLAARILASAEPEGLTDDELGARMLRHPVRNIRELTGSAGDVVLIHPFLLHARSANTGDRVRFISNPCISLKEPMNLHSSDRSDYSPVELAIVDALEG